jgi:hypothetical protein
MKPVSGNIENKQRVNLSNHANAVLQKDFEDYESEISWYGFLNDIISGYRKRAKASIDIQIQEYREELIKILSSFDQCSEMQHIIDRLVDSYQEKLTDKMKRERYPKSESVLFRLNKENFSLLYGSEGCPGAESAHYDRPSLYLKALFEEFARLPSCERERIYSRKKIEDLEDSAIANGYIIEIVLGNQMYHMRPYKIIQDTEHRHLYLAGRSRNISRQEDEKIASFRLSNLGSNARQAKELPAKKLTKDEKLDIDDKIRKVGVQYLVADDNVITKLRFHYSGKKMYRRKAQLRPAYVKKTDDDIYIFNCSTEQIANYFFSFGRNVEILEPEKLRRDFMVGYKRAYELYDNEST